MLNEKQIREGLHQAYLMAICSKDLSTQNGAVIMSGGKVLSGGFNGPTLGMSWENSWVRHKKYSFVEHAERSAIYNAVRKGRKTADTTMFSLWASCADCARAIVGAGITTLVRHYHPHAHSPERWAETMQDGEMILRAAGIEIIEYRGQIGTEKIQFDGNPWWP
jgi:deoxycytidylate deaminase